MKAKIRAIFESKKVPRCPILLLKNKMFLIGVEEMIDLDLETLLTSFVFSFQTIDTFVKETRQQLNRDIDNVVSSKIRMLQNVYSFSLHVLNFLK